MKKLFNVKTVIISALITWLLSSCHTTKNLHTSSTVKDSNSIKAGKSVTVKKSDSSNYQLNKKTRVKTDKGTSRTAAKEKNTEVSTTEYQLLKVTTKAGDYLGPDLTRLNDDWVAAKKTKTKKQQQKSKTVTEQKDKSDSMGILFIQGGDIARADSTDIDTTKTVTTHSDVEVKDLHKKTSYWSWWYLLLIPVLYGLYRWAKNKSFITKIFPL